MLLSAMGIAAAQQRRRAGAAKVNRLTMYLLRVDQRAQKSREQRPGKASRGSAACSRSACKPSPAPSSRDAHSDLSAQVSRLEVHGVGRLPFCPWPRGPWPITLSRIKRGSACRRYQRDPQGT